MSYISKHGNGLMGFGDDVGGAVCRTGAAQFTNGNWWVPVKDASGKAYQLMQTNEILALPMCSSGSSSGGSSIWDKIIGGATDVLKAKLTPAPVTNITTAPSGPSLSTTTKLAIAGGAVVGGILLIRHFKK